MSSYTAEAQAVRPPPVKQTINSLLMELHEQISRHESAIGSLLAHLEPVRFSMPTPERADKEPPNQPCSAVEGIIIEAIRRVRSCSHRLNELGEEIALEPLRNDNTLDAPTPTLGGIARGR